VCWKLDRLGRSLKHLISTIEDLAAYGVSFVALRDNVDLSTPAGRLDDGGSTDSSVVVALCA
jgi:DNA invertase Pin-like site-specific DNA recombinase